MSESFPVHPVQPVVSPSQPSTQFWLPPPTSPLVRQTGYISPRYRGQEQKKILESPPIRIVVSAR